MTAAMMVGLFVGSSVDWKVAMTSVQMAVLTADCLVV